MKNTIYGIVITMLGLIMILTILTITTTMNREIDIEDALNIATKKCVERCTGSGQVYESNDQLIAALLVELSNEVENDSNLRVDVMGVDKDKGFLSIRVTQYYKTPTGTMKTAVSETTAFVDRGFGEDMAAGYIMTFIDSDGAYLGEQRVDEGYAVLAPITPTKSGYVFNGWINAATHEYIGNALGLAYEDTVYMATYV